MCVQVWLLKGKSDDMYRAMWVRAMDDMIDKLLRYSDEGYAYVGDLKGCACRPPAAALAALCCLPPRQHSAACMHALRLTSL